MIPALAAEGVRLTLFVPREAAHEDWGADVEVVRLPVEARSRARRVLAEQTLLPQAVRRARLDLLHNAFTTAPVLPGVPQVTTILDVIYRRFPEAHAGLLAYGMRVLVPLAARRSRRILTLSEAARRDIVEYLGVSPERVDVAYLGPGIPDDVAPASDDEVRRRFDLGSEPIVLSVSAKRPHKNLERLLDAFGGLEEQATLVVPGYETAFEDALRRHAEAAARGRVRFAGWVDEPTLDGLYRAATCFVFPSLAEGFGLPVLEALRRGVPVACSNASSLPEVAGDAALYFDPYDMAAIRGALERLLGDASLRERLREAGFAQAGKFSWEATARETLASYDRALTT